MTSLGLTLPLSIVTLLGLALNGYILIVVILTRQAASANNLLLLHLGVLNTLLGILFLAFSMPGVSRTAWLSLGVPCALHGFLFTLLHPLVLWTICGLNCDRYYAIAAPLHYGHLVSQKKVLIGLGAGWAVSLALCFPPLFSVAPYTYSPGLGACAPDFSLGLGALWYSACYTAFTLLLPATLIVCCNLKILMIARYHRHRIASAIYEVTLSAQVTITHQRNPFFVPTITAPAAGGPRFRGKSAISTVLQLLGSFLLLYLPYYGVILWEAALGTLQDTAVKIDSHFFTLASVLLTCSPSVNGFLYGVKNKALRKTFQNYWRKKVTKSEVNQEIQARTPSTCGSRRPSLTPLGFFNKPTITRRLSEAILDVHKAVSFSHRPKIKRIGSELSWRPTSTPGLNLSPTEEYYKRKLPQTASCNTLQVPVHEIDNLSTVADEDILTANKKRNSDDLLNKSSLSSANLFFHRVFGIETEQRNKKASLIQSVLDATPKRSPRILITRAFSEESEKSSSVPVTPAKDVVKKRHFSSSNLVEQKWGQLECGDEDSDDQQITMKPLLSSTDRESTCSNRSSDSSDASEKYTGRLYMALDSKPILNKIVNDDCSQMEKLSLLSWSNNKLFADNETSLQNNNSSLLIQSPLVQSDELIM